MEGGRAVTRETHVAVDDLVQIAERLRWSPKERLQYLLDMLAFEQRARDARIVEGTS